MFLLAVMSGVLGGVMLFLLAMSLRSPGSDRSVRFPVPVASVTTITPDGTPLHDVAPRATVIPAPRAVGSAAPVRDFDGDAWRVAAKSATEQIATLSRAIHEALAARTPLDAERVLRAAVSGPALIDGPEIVDARTGRRGRYLETRGEEIARLSAR